MSVRDSIIIATSNAASDTIWRLFREGKDTAIHRDKLMDEIIERGIFKPELLNRFDGIIVFHSLSEDQIRNVALLMLEKLKQRLKGQGIDLVVTDDVVDVLVKYGYNPQFGARPMNRAIQEKVEKLIARKILHKEIAPGEKLVLDRSELENV